MNRIALLSLLLTFGAVLLATERARDDRPAAANRVFELRTYTTHPGKLDDLHKRFRDHTNRLFRKHGMDLVAYWTPQDEKDGKADTLIYVIAFPSRDAAKASWQAFQSDPEWQKVRAESEQNGKIVKEVKSVYMDPTDYSPIK